MDHAATNHGSGSMTAMQPPLNDVEFDAYLANDRTLDDPETVRVEPAGVRLRIINASASTNFWLDLGALAGDLLAVDGHASRRCPPAAFRSPSPQRIDIRLYLPRARSPIPSWRYARATPRGPASSWRRRVPRSRAFRPREDASRRARSGSGAPLCGARSSPRGAADRRARTPELTGNMMGYIWGLNGRRFGEHAARSAQERARRDRDGEPHRHVPPNPSPRPPISGGGDRRATRSAARCAIPCLVPVNGRVTIAFDADNPGRWAFHCHNLYHMAAGMMTSVRYET